MSWRSRCMQMTMSSGNFVFFYNETTTTAIYTLSLHDALPIYGAATNAIASTMASARTRAASRVDDGIGALDRKSTRLNSSHANISYAVFCLKKKIKK